jgi:YidC/Oxa1 family membrane protein insertase
LNKTKSKKIKKNNKIKTLKLSIKNKNIINSISIVNIKKLFINSQFYPLQLTNIILSLKKMAIKPNTIKNIESNFYIGSKEFNILSKFGYNLEENIDLGSFAIIGRPMLSLLLFIFYYISNFGISIILLTILIKIMTFPLTKKSMLSLEKTKNITPKIKMLQRKYAHNKDILNQKQLEK